MGHGDGIVHVRGARVSHSLDVGGAGFTCRGDRAGLSATANIAPGAARGRSDDAALERFFHRDPSAGGDTVGGAGLSRYGVIDTTDRRGVLPAGVRHDPAVADGNVSGIQEAGLRRTLVAAKRATQRRIIVYIATSADGYIARPDGSVDWLERPMPEDGYGMTAFARSIDTILWGRKTYDFAAKMGGVGVYGKVKHYAFSRQPPPEPLPEVEFVSDAIPEFVGKRRAGRGKNIWMMGGAGIIASFLDAGAIDE